VWVGGGLCCLCVCVCVSLCMYVSLCMFVWYCVSVGFSLRYTWVCVSGVLVEVHVCVSGVLHAAGGPLHRRSVSRRRLQLSCESDFVARNEQFAELAGAVAGSTLTQAPGATGTVQVTPLQTWLRDGSISPLLVFFACDRSLMSRPWQRAHG
jgi:hypothetical protein